MNIITALVRSCIIFINQGFTQKWKHNFFKSRVVDRLKKSLKAEFNDESSVKFIRENLVFFLIPIFRYLPKSLHNILLATLIKASII